MTLTEHMLAGGLLPKGGLLTAAFSGGADSTALLIGLCELQSVCGYTLHAVHVHHGIRGEEADRDAAFCAEVCKQYGIPFQCVYVAAPAYAAEHKLSIETAARILRYQALEKAAPAGLIATAHHAEDNAETVLFHLIRGSGMRGLRGIPKRNGRIIRPLLEVPKAAILQYLDIKKQNFVVDSTNFSRDSTRSRLRQTLLPVLAAENPAYLTHISRMSALLTADEAYLTERAAAQLGDGAVTGRIPVSAETQKPVRMRMYLLRLDFLHIDAAFDLLEAVDGIATAGSGKLCISGDVYAAAARGMLYIYREAKPLTGEVPLQIGENRVYAGKICLAAVAEMGGISQNAHKSDMQYSLDADKIQGRPYFRQRSGSDRLALGGQRPRELKKLVQAAVPMPERSSLHTLYDDAGCIFCEGVGIAARVQPDEGTRRVLRLTVILNAE